MVLVKIYVHISELDIVGINQNSNMLNKCIVEEAKSWNKGN
jgi:hypothetical protein